MSITVNGTTGFTFNDASTQNTAATGFGFKNRIINGDMRIDQRNSGTAYTLGTNGNYGGPDRFVTSWDGTLGAGTVQQLGFSNGNGLFPDNKYYYRWNQTAGGSGNTVKFLQQRIEFVETLHNSSATFSFWARADSAISVTPDIVQVFGYGGTPSSPTTTAGSAISITTSWARYSVTFSVPTIVGKLKGTSGTDSVWVRLNMPPNSVFGFETTGWQLEKGSTVTDFDVRPYGTELALCQRYYWQKTSVNATVGVYRTTTTLENIQVSCPVTMRTTPTCSLPSLAGNIFVNGSSTLITGGTANGEGLNAVSINLTSAGQPQNAAAWSGITSTLTVSAEL